MAIIALQSDMEVTIGQVVLDDAPGTSFVGSVDLPITSRNSRSSADHSYVAFCNTLQRDALADPMADAPQFTAESGNCYAFGPAADGLTDACTRLLALRETPEVAAMLGRLIHREILYRSLRGPQGATLHKIGAPDATLAPVGRARILTGAI